MILPDRDKEVLRTIQTKKKMDGYAPTVREVAKLIGCSHATAHSIIQILRRLGYLYPVEHNEKRSLALTEKGENELRKSPIVAPSPEHNDQDVVCRYEYAPTPAKFEHHLIYTDGTCSCKVHDCFHIRAAVDALNGLIDELEETIPTSEEHSRWIIDTMRSMMQWMTDNRERFDTPLSHSVQNGQRVTLHYRS
jgi:DNA-binding MarR family transcriptional regulator